MRQGEKCWWPMALRYLMESSRIRRRNEAMKIPMFGEKVLVKKRIWKTKMLEPTHQGCRYLAPMIEAHRRCILKEDGSWGVAPYVIKNVQMPPPPTEEMWLALMEQAEQDEVQERRGSRKEANSLRAWRRIAPTEDDDQRRSQGHRRRVAGKRSSHIPALRA